MRNVSVNGYGWASYAVTYSAAVNANAYRLSFNAIGLSGTSGPDSRYIGNPVRCLASGD